MRGKQSIRKESDILEENIKEQGDKKEEQFHLHF